MGSVYVALLHYPVQNKNNEIIVSAVTNLDLHDIARASITFGAARFYVITPDEEQIQLAQKILLHWTAGFGSTYNEKRKEALSLIRIVNSLEIARAEIKKETEKPIKTIATSAENGQGRISFEFLRSEIKKEKASYLILLGTAWGLSPECVQESDEVLEPIYGRGVYNHLSVRSAAAIMLDRLLGDR